MSQKTYSGGVGANKDNSVTDSPDGALTAVEAVSSDESVESVVKKSDGIYNITHLAAGTANNSFSKYGN